MKPTNRFRLPWRSRDAIAADVDAELEFHLQARTAELVRGGLAADAARREAEREFGDIEGTRAYCRAEDGRLERADRRRGMWDEFRGNVRLAFRSLRRGRAFTAVTLVTLTLVIGANTSIFSVANAVLIAPLPYGEPGRVVAVYGNNVTSGNQRGQLSAADFVDYREAQRTLTGIAVYARSGAVFRTGTDDPVALQHLRVSANMFDVLGARARYGRTFTRDEDAPPGAPVVILAYGAWMRLFNGDTTAVGRTVFVNDRPMTLIGVMPRAFGLGRAEDLYTPLDLTPQLRDVSRARQMHWLYGLARLKPNVPLATAQADLGGIAHRLEAQYPDVNKGQGVALVSMQTALAGDAAKTAMLLLGAAALVLMVACTNLTNMMLARAATRGRELTIRAAIGAGRRDLIAELLTESMLLALTGGALGVGVSLVMTPLIVRIAKPALPVLASPTVDWRVLLATAVVSLIVGVAMGVVPALRASRAAASDVLKGGGRGSAGDRRHTAMHSALVMSQAAMAVVLLVIAGLLTRSLQAVQRVEMGFDPEHVLVTGIVLRGQAYQQRDDYNRFYDALFEHLRATPGVRAVGASAGVPLIGSSTCGLLVEGRPVPEQVPEVGCTAARGDYFAALRIPIVRGRAFDANDLPNGPNVVVISASLAVQYFPSEDPIGKRIRLGPDFQEPGQTIVGVVGDVRANSLEERPTPTVIEYDAQHGWGTLAVVVRGDGAPAALMPAVRAAVKATDPSLAVRMLRTMDEIIGLTLAQRKFSMALIAAFAALGLVLAALGLYGVLSYTVAARTREFGIRVALGANVRQVSTSVVARGLAWSLVGLAIGASGAWLTARAIRAMLFGVAPADPVSFGVAAAALVTVAFVACVVPAWRATRADPLIAMRSE